MFFLQVSIFTVGIWHRGTHSCAIVSDSLDHRKDAIIPFIHEILKDLPPTAKRIVIYSDNPTSQFKNKFVMSSIIELGKKFGVDIMWSFFCPQHGKGVVDGIGATVKMYVRTRVVNRRVIVNSAEEFFGACQGINVNIKYIPATKIKTITEELDLTQIFLTAKPMKGITSNYCIKIENDLPKQYFLKKYTNIN